MNPLSTHHASILRHIAANRIYCPGPDNAIICNELFDRGLVGRIESAHGLFCYYPTLAGLKVIGDTK